MASGDDRIIRVLRSQAWERAKGEMFSMLHTFYPDDIRTSNPGQYEALRRAYENFVSEVEVNGLHE